MIKKSKSDQANFQAEIFGDLPHDDYHSSDSQLDRYLINRLNSLSNIKRLLTLLFTFFIVLGTLLIFQIRGLTAYYTYLAPEEGGIYIEGIVGEPGNFNPIYATSQVDQAVVRLVFDGLVVHDGENILRPGLAESLEVDQSNKSFKVKLRDNIFWHDGQPITAEDVIFTVQTIQNPDAQSHLRLAWQGVSISGLEDDDKTVIFDLPASHSSFMDNLNLAILPSHLLSDINPKQLRNHNFNAQPVGSGMFKFKGLVDLSELDEHQETIIGLVRNDDYRGPGHNPEKPLIQGFNFHVVDNHERLTELFNQGKISGAANLIESGISLLESDYQKIDLDLIAGVYLFFKNSSNKLSDARIRTLLSQAISVGEALEVLERPVSKIDGPLLPEHLGYLPADNQQRKLSLIDIKQELTELGYVFNQAEQAWYKDEQKLVFNLTTQQDTDYVLLAQNIQKQLEKVGITVVLDIRPSDIFAREVLERHNYQDMLIYGLNLGGDSDVYSYWHSSQIDSHSTLRLNLAEYRSGAADEALEAGRSRNDLAVRQLRYREFQEVWRTDRPAIPLYRPHISYYTLKGVKGPDRKLIISQTDRFSDANQWAVSSQRRPLID